MAFLDLLSYYQRRWKIVVGIKEPSTRPILPQNGSSCRGRSRYEPQNGGEIANA